MLVQVAQRNPERWHAQVRGQRPRLLHRQLVRQCDMLPSEPNRDLCRWRRRLLLLLLLLLQPMLLLQQQLLQLLLLLLLLLHLPLRARLYLGRPCLLLLLRHLL